MQSIENKIIARIYGNGRGWAFSKIDFADISGQSTIDWVLYRLEKEGKIRRAIRGIYYYPQESTFLKEILPPDIPQIAQALARKFNWSIEPSGETALNILGISTQVPSQYLYISNGRTKEYQIGNRTLRFKKGMLKETGFKHSESSLLVQGIRALGQHNISESVLEKIKPQIPETKRKAILKETRSVTFWIYSAIQKICREQ